MTLKLPLLVKTTAGIVIPALSNCSVKLRKLVMPLKLGIDAPVFELRNAISRILLNTAGAVLLNVTLPPKLFANDPNKISELAVATPKMTEPLVAVITPLCVIDPPAVTVKLPFKVAAGIAMLALSKIKVKLRRLVIPLRLGIEALVLLLRIAMSCILVSAAGEVLLNKMLVPKSFANEANKISEPAADTPNVAVLVSPILIMPLCEIVPLATTSIFPVTDTVGMLILELSNIRVKLRKVAGKVGIEADALMLRKPKSRTVPLPPNETPPLKLLACVLKRISEAIAF